MATNDLKRKAGTMVTAVRTINRSRNQEMKIPGDDDPVYWQRKEWIEWILELADELEQAAQDA